MGVARFSFHELCERPLGANDYLKIAHQFHPLVLDRVPVMTYATRNEAKRFIALIDTLYDNAVKLVASAAAAPGALLYRPRGLRGPGVPSHRLAPDRDGVGGLSRPAARPRPCENVGVERRPGGDLKILKPGPAGRPRRGKAACRAAANSVEDHAKFGGAEAPNGATGDWTRGLPWYGLGSSEIEVQPTIGLLAANRQNG